MVIQAIIAPIASEAVLSSAGGFFNDAFPEYGIYAAIFGGIVGSLLGAIVAFYIARWVQGVVKEKFVDKYAEDGTDLELDTEMSRRDRYAHKFANFSRRFIDEESDDFVEIIEERGFLIVLVGRIIPFVPFDAVSYAAGFTRIRFKDFMIATFIGTIPRVIFYVLLGTELADALENNFSLFVILFVTFAGGIYGLYKWIMYYLRTQNKEEDGNEGDKPSKKNYVIREG